jgi:hypothetical protein
MGWIKWLATSFVTLSALTITLFPETALHPPIFFTFLLGHLLWVTMAFKMKEWALLYLNGFFCIIDVIGVIIRL